MALILQGKIPPRSIRHADNTRKSYRSDFKLFERWCEANGYRSLPAETNTVLLYCHALLERGRKVASLIRYVTGINHQHRVSGYELPATSLVYQFLLAVRRMRGEQPTQKHAITTEEMKAICAELPDDLGGRRDRSLLLLGFTSTLRRENLAALNLADIAFCEEGLRIQVRREKGDRRGEGRIVGVVRGAELCPVAALGAWLDVRGREDGPLYQQIKGGEILGRRLRTCQVAEIVKTAAARIGLDPVRIGAHSLRAGAVTSLLDRGVPETLIMEQTGHKSITMLRLYRRRTNLFKANVSGMLGL